MRKALVEYLVRSLWLTDETSEVVQDISRCRGLSRPLHFEQINYRASHLSFLSFLKHTCSFLSQQTRRASKFDSKKEASWSPSDGHPVMHSARAEQQKVSIEKQWPRAKQNQVAV
jgi:hypothetical protein